MRSVLLVVAMQQEAQPIIDAFDMRKLDHAFLPGAAFVAWQGMIGELTVRLVWCGRDERYGGNNVGTTAAAVATYAALAAFANTDSPPELVLSVGTAGGFGEKGAGIADVYLSSKCVFHARRIPEGGAWGELEEQGFGASHIQSPRGPSTAAGISGSNALPCRARCFALCRAAIPSAR